MKNIIAKVDQWIYDQFTYWTVRWVKKHKFKKHKYHLLGKLQVYWLCFMVFFAAFYCVYAIYHHKNLVVLGFGGMVWLMLFVMEMLDLHFIASLSDDYEWLFERRKQPAVYNAIKASMQTRFEEQAGGRQFMVGVNLFIIALILTTHFTSPILIPLYCLSTYRQYVHCIFDFDPPDKKKKPKESRLTDLVMGLWERLTESFKPQQQPVPV